MKKTSLMMVLIAIFMLVSRSASFYREALGAGDALETESSFGDPHDKSGLPVLTDKSILDDYVHYAMLNNPGLQGAFDRWKSALQKVAASQTLPDPRFTYSHYIEEVETRVGAQKHAFGITQMFPWFGKLDLKGKIALEKANVEKQRFEKMRLKVIDKVKQIYCEYYFLGRSIDITGENRALLHYLESVARTRYKSGDARQGAIIKVQVELGKLEDRLSSLRDMMRVLKTKLNSTLNRPAHAPLSVPKILSQETFNMEDEHLVSLLLANNPELKVFDIMKTKEDLEVELASKNYFPDMTLGLNYIQTDSRTDMNPEDNGKDPVIALLSLNIPIWRKKYDAAKQEALIRRRAVEGERSDKKNKLIADLESALYELRDAMRKIILYRDTLIPQAKQAMQVIQTAFMSGKAGLLDLIDSQRILLDFELNYERALTNRSQQISEIKRLVGEE
ncbi:MAG: TolC family protein [Desulfatiglans sp.]|jgi:outer membrane protein TolC|nr:TolC family protein [Desulfatiglans sp.]